MAMPDDPSLDHNDYFGFYWDKDVPTLTGQGRKYVDAEQGNKIHDLTPLAGLKFLQELDMSANCIDGLHDNVLPVTKGLHFLSSLNLMVALPSHHALFNPVVALPFQHALFNPECSPPIMSCKISLAYIWSL